MALCYEAAALVSGWVEVDESYYGRAYAEIVPDC